jgi:hypothetical protein
MSSTLSATSISISGSTSLPLTNAVSITLSAQSSAVSGTIYTIGTVTLDAGVWLIFCKAYLNMSGVSQLQVTAYVGTDSTGGGSNILGFDGHPLPLFSNGGFQGSTYVIQRIVVPTTSTTYYIRVRCANLTSGTLGINSSGSSHEAYAVRLA